MRLRALVVLCVGLTGFAPGATTAAYRATASSAFIDCPDGSVVASHEICAATGAAPLQPVTRPNPVARAGRATSPAVGRPAAGPDPATSNVTVTAQASLDRPEGAAVISTAAIAALIVKESRSAYYATGRPCACPDDRMRNGHVCGGRSAYSRPGGAAPLCYPSDVTAGQISEYRARRTDR
jgi:hypothetical protein